MESKLSMEACEIKTGSVGIKHFFPQLWLHIRITWRTSGTLDVLPAPLANQMGICGIGPLDCSLPSLTDLLLTSAESWLAGPC